MLLNPVFQQRIKHFDLLLAKELSIIEREYLHNLLLHEKLENSIRRSNQQPSVNHRNHMPIYFDNIYNERHRSLDYHNINTLEPSNTDQKLPSIHPNAHQQKHRDSDPNNAFEDVSRESLLEKRRKSVKACPLPPIIKANMNERLRRESKNRHCMTNLQPENNKLVAEQDPFTISKEITNRNNPRETSPIQKQVHSFLDTLPTYQGVQKGFDSFAAASLYSFRKPIILR